VKERPSHHPRGRTVNARQALGMWASRLVLTGVVRPGLLPHPKNIESPSIRNRFQKWLPSVQFRGSLWNWLYSRVTPNDPPGQVPLCSREGQLSLRDDALRQQQFNLSVQTTDPPRSRAVPHSHPPLHPFCRVLTPFAIFPRPYLRASSILRRQILNHN